MVSLRNNNKKEHWYIDLTARINNPSNFKP